MIEVKCQIRAQDVLDVVRTYADNRGDRERDSIKAMRTDWSDVERKRVAIAVSNMSERWYKEACEKMKIMHKFTSFSWKTVMDLKRIADRLHLFWAPEEVYDWNELEDERAKADTILKFLMQDDGLYEWMNWQFTCEDEDDIPF